MSSICHRCALRLQRAAQADTRCFGQRMLSTTPSTRAAALPTFSESSNAELNEVLSTLREKHFITSQLRPRERKLIFAQKFRHQLTENPQTTVIGDEEVDLKWIDRKKDIPNRGKLVVRALNLLLEGEKRDWQNLPELLLGLHKAKHQLSDGQIEKIVRKALQAGQLGVIIQCLQRADKTGLTLKNEALLRGLLVALHQLAQNAGWSKSATQKALKDANVILLCLGSDMHGSGRKLADNDPRTRPEVMGLFLELAAVFAQQHADRGESQEVVKAYAGRLGSCLESRSTKPQNLTLQTRTRQWPMLTAIPIWHGLRVAQKFLGKDMPKASVASEAVTNYEVALTNLASELESRSPQPGSYDDEALTAWKRCIRD